MAGRNREVMARANVAKRVVQPATVRASDSAFKATRKSALIAPRPPAKRSRETRAARRERALRILRGLRALYPAAECALHHHGPYELLVAVILSAQCTDQRVNLVTPALFARYPDPAALAAAKPADVETLIRSTGFFRNKTKNLIAMAQRVMSEFGGQIPCEMGALLTLAGVARKTANCILGTSYGKNDGVVVDTHVGRLAVRLRLLTSAKDDKDAVRIERDLMPLFPQESWTFLAHALIDHGRAICTARAPKCSRCRLAPDCPSAFRGANHE